MVEITKDVDRTEIDIAPDGGDLPLHGDRDAGRPGRPERGTLGTITVTNPNNFPATAIVTDNLSECTVTGP